MFQLCSTPKKDLKNVKERELENLVHNQSKII